MNCVSCYCIINMNWFRTTHIQNWTILIRTSINCILQPIAITIRTRIDPFSCTCFRTCLIRITDSISIIVCAIRAFARVITLSPGFFERVMTGEILSRLTADTTVLQVVVGSTASMALRNVLLLIGGIVVTVYFTAGGLLTSVWVNTVQLVVLLVGFSVACPLILASVGGWSPVLENTRNIDGYWNIWRGGGSGWFYIAMLGPSFIVSPGILQRVYGARDDRAVQLGVGLNGVALLVFAAAPALLGMIARSVAQLPY
mgnify:CR=1 FL=1